MPEVRKHCNVYGFLGLFVAITCGISWYLVDSKGCVPDAGTLNGYHIVGLVTGIIICVLGVFNFANFLYDIVVAFYIAVVAIACVGCLMAYAAWFTFGRPCLSLSVGIGKITELVSGEKNRDTNVFGAKDGELIAVFVLNICAALMLFSAAGNFYRRT